MASAGTITIVGGGLAGLTLGIGLRQHGVPAEIFEAGTYPRHRVCGEFISGNGPAVLERLGLLPLLERAGAIRVASVAFIAGETRSPVRQLSAPALGLSRHLLDALLAEEFQRLGGQLHRATRWIPPTRDGASPGSAGVAPARAPGEGTIRATGRRAQPTENGWRWFGLKAHARNVPLTADLEMHVSADNYVGVNRINNGEVNVCGLFRRRPGDMREFRFPPFHRSRQNLELSRNNPPQSVSLSATEWGRGGAPNSGETDSSPSGFNLLRGAPGSSLHEKLERAEFDKDSFCSVAGLSLTPQQAADKTDCCIGDAVTMIPPVTGNGMSMAFESAEIAIAPLCRYSRGETSWAETREAIARACDSAFAGRLTWARRLQSLMFSPVLRTPVASVLLRSDALWNFLFARTR